MTENSSETLCDEQNNDGIIMEAEIVDQINTNQQSNMTLSSHSVITQTGSTVKINIV